MAGVIHIKWYATVLRQDAFAAEVARSAPVALRYGATKYSVQRSDDDRYAITQMVWFASHHDFYRYWNSPEIIEFRRRNSGHFQIPINYIWHEEFAAGELGPEVPLAPEPEPEPQPEPQAI